MAAMKTSLLMLMLLLSAAVSAHGRPVSCTNLCPVPVTVCGVVVEVGVTLDVEVKDVVEISVKDKLGAVLLGSYKCPKDVKALLVVYEDSCVKVKVAAVDLITGLLHTLLGSLLGFIKCYL